MVRDKEFYSEIEDALKMVYSLIEMIRLDKSKLYLSRFEKYNNFLLRLIDILTKDSIAVSSIAKDFVIKYIEPILYICEHPDEFADPVEYKRLEIQFAQADNAFYNMFSDKTGNDIQKAINSEEYYNSQIEELKRRETELKSELSKNKSASQEQKKEAEETKKKLLEIKQQLASKEKELKQKKQQEDAKKDWELKITSAFEELSKYNSRFTNEKKHLDNSRRTFYLLSFAMGALLLGLEFLIYYRLTGDTDPIEFKKQILSYLPIPLLGGLAWAFIYQANRAQRLGILIANKIHSIEYVQGLLLSINTLAPNIEDSITRVNAALDRLIDNHLSQKEKDVEANLLKEEDKDKLPVDAVLKILKEVKEIGK